MILPEMGRGTAPAGRGGGGGSLRKPAVYTARKLRKQMSPPEALLWQELRGQRLGFKVRRQHPIGPYVVDFFVPKGNLVIKIDGSPHDFGDRPRRDEQREQYLRKRGYDVLRIAARDVLKELDLALKMIVVRVPHPLHHAAHGPAPHAGEDC